MRLRSVGGTAILSRDKNSGSKTEKGEGLRFCRCTSLEDSLSKTLLHMVLSHRNRDSSWDLPYTSSLSGLWSKMHSVIVILKQKGFLSHRSRSGHHVRDFSQIIYPDFFLVFFSFRPSMSITYALLLHSTGVSALPHPVKHCRWTDLLLFSRPR